MIVLWYRCKIGGTWKEHKECEYIWVSLGICLLSLPASKYQCKILWTPLDVSLYDFEQPWQYLWLYLHSHYWYDTSLSSQQKFRLSWFNHSYAEQNTLIQTENSKVMRAHQVYFTMLFKLFVVVTCHQVVSDLWWCFDVVTYYFHTYIQCVMFSHFKS